MQRPTRHDATEITSPRSSRAPSLTSERTSVAASTPQFKMPTEIKPPAAYVAVAAASQMVTDHQLALMRERFGVDGSPPTPTDEMALFSDEALALLNSFLDYLLYSFLFTARSTALRAIRPAIQEVLKPKLAREAMAAADQELEDLLAEDEEEEEDDALGLEDGSESATAFDLERVWKRTRLRIMVYIRLGEMEDEDEMRYLDQDESLVAEGADEDDAQERDLVSWAAAIFLTSVIEHIAEMTLTVAGQAAYSRIAAKRKRNAQSPTAAQDGDELDRVVVSEYDAEKVALNSTLGRLWRTWKRSVRSPLGSSRNGTTRGPTSPTSPASSHRRRRSSAAAGDVRRPSVPDVPEVLPSETAIAANIPIPVGHNDVAEIEVPGLAREYDDDGVEKPIATAEDAPRRRSSFSLLSPFQFQMWRRGDESEKDATARHRSLPPPEKRLEAEAAQEPVVDEDNADTVTAGAQEEKGVVPTEPSEMSRNVDETSKEADKPHTHEQQGMIAGVVAGATAMAAGAVAAVTGTRQSDTSISHQPNANADTIHEIAEGLPHGAKQSPEEMAAEEEQEPGVDLSSFAGGPAQHGEQVQAPREGKGLLNGSAYKEAPVEDATNGAEDHSLIGVARTSDTPVASPSPTPYDKHHSFRDTAAAEGFAKEQKAWNEKRGSRRISVSPPVSKNAGTPVERSASASPDIARHQDDNLRPRPLSTSSRTTPLAAVSEAAAVGAAAAAATATATQTPKNVRDAHGTTNSIDATEPTESIYAAPRSRAGTATSSRYSQEPAPNTRTSNGSYGTSGAPKTFYDDGSRSARNSRPSTDTHTAERAGLQRVPSSSSTTRSAGTSILDSTRNSDASASRLTKPRTSEEDKQREFDALVHSEETVKYTLTPQTMRETVS